MSEIEVPQQPRESEYKDDDSDYDPNECACKCHCTGVFVLHWSRGYATCDCHESHKIDDGCLCGVCEDKRNPREIDGDDNGDDQGESYDDGEDELCR